MDSTTLTQGKAITNLRAAQLAAEQRGDIKAARTLDRFATDRPEHLRRRHEDTERSVERMRRTPAAVELERRARAAWRHTPITTGSGLSARDPWLEGAA